MTVKISLGYDTERPYGSWAETSEGDAFRQKQLMFVRSLSQFLDSEHVPRTHFILGNYLDCCQRTVSKEELGEIYGKENTLMELQQHSYSHPIFRPTQESDKSAVSTEVFIADVKKASDVIESILGVRPTGLRTPRGYERDLSDRADIILGLQSEGMMYVSSNLRSATNIDGPYTPERQPHSYAHVGFPSLIELPSHGWQDAIFAPEHAQKFLGRDPDTPDQVVAHYESLFNQASELARETQKTAYVSLCLHPWCMMQWDPRLEIHRRFIDSGRECGVKFVSYGTIADEVREEENRLRNEQL